MAAAAANNNHSHRSGKLKQTNKRNKRSNASKRSITRNSGGKVNSLSLGGGGKRGGGRGSLKGGRDHISKAKANRINSAKQRRSISKKNIWSNRRFGTSHAGGATISAGSTTSPKLIGLEGTLNRAISNVPPRIIGIISLSENEVQLENLVRCTLLNDADKVLTISNSTRNNSLSNSTTLNSASITAAYNTHSKGGQPHLTLLTNSSSFNSQYNDKYDDDDVAIQSALDLCRICDLVMFVIDGSSVVTNFAHGGSSTVGGSTVGGGMVGGSDMQSIGGGGMSVKTNNTTAHLDHIISDRGDRILVAIRGQGLPTPVTVIVHKENSSAEGGMEGILGDNVIGGLPKDIGSVAGEVQDMQDDDSEDEEDEMVDCVTSLQGGGPSSTSIGGRSMKSIRRSTIRKRSELKRYVSRLAATEFGEGISKIVELDIPSSVVDSSGVEKMEDDSAIATSTATALTSMKNKSQTSVAALVRMLCTISASGPNWVTDSMRPFLVTDGTIHDSSSSSTSKVNVPPVKYNESTQELSLTGYIRGNTVWNTNQLVHVPHLGTFAVKDVKLAGVNVSTNGDGNDELLPPIVAAGRKVRKVKSSSTDKDMKDVTAAESDSKEGMILAKPNLEERESLEMFASPDALEGEQNLIGFDDIEEEGDEFDLNDEGGEGDKKKSSSVQFQPGTARPAGWSDYQSAWLDALDPNEDEDADDRGELAFALNKKTNDADTLMGGDDDDDDGINAEEKRILLAQRKKDAKSDLQFPDEVDYEEETSARDRYARYRALKSFRKSYWDPKENLPESYGAVYHFSSFKSTQRDVLEDVKEVEDVVKRRGWGVTVGGLGDGGDDAAMMDDEERDSDDEEEEDMARSCVIPGAYVTITLENVPLSAYTILSPSTLLVAVSLLPHENKVSVLHMGLTHSSKSEHDTEIPIKSKDVLTFRCGWRTWQSRPVFSQHNLNSDKHKFERYMPEGGGGTYFAASVFGPVTYAPCPVLMFREANEGSRTGDIGSGSFKKREFLAHGSMLGADADRIVLKRIILTGYPTRVHKRHATVKYMFYNPEDVKVRRRLEVSYVVF